MLSPEASLQVLKSILIMDPAPEVIECVREQFVRIAQEEIRLRYGIVIDVPPAPTSCRCKCQSG